MSGPRATETESSILVLQQLARFVEFPTENEQSGVGKGLENANK